MTREQLFERVKRVLDGHAERMGRELAALTDEIVALVPKLVREQLMGAFADLGNQSTPPVTKRTARKPSTPDPSPKQPKQRGKRGNTCKACGAAGFTSRTCGKTHNVAASPIASAPIAAVDSKPPPQPTSRASRFAAIESAAAARRATGLDA
ncbi:MAG: hypothetical protein M3619_00775 [Myxococcota bacterium]|nr:hypothetical protein [Myxococcota bacterium]